MRQIEFHNREKEIREFRDILNAEPSLITFVYGPINSGKTALFDHLIKQLPADYVVFYINLRGKFISNYDDFVRALFKLEREEKGYKELLKNISEVTLKSLKFTGIPITKDILDLLFRNKTYEDVFEFLEDYFTKISVNKVPVLILDELQKIGDVRINTYLIYELFNLFIRLTKELHLCHVFAVSSDLLFIERVFSEAMLEGRCRYLLVDDFNYETTMEFLDCYKFSENEKEAVWEYCGGKPVCLVELMNYENREEKAKEMLRIRRSQIDQRIGVLKDVRKKVLFEGVEIEITYDNIMKILERFSEAESYEYVRVIAEVTYLVKENILFVDPANSIIKPQSRLNLLAIREILRRGDEK